MHTLKGRSIGIIPDRNRTWSEKKHGNQNPDSLLHGYMQGSEVAKQLITFGHEMHLRLMVLWGMSDKNMAERPLDQKGILYQVFENQLSDLQENYLNKPKNSMVRFVHIGRRDALQAEAPHVLQRIDDLSRHTQKRTGMVLAFALDYGGHDDSNRAHQLWADHNYDGDRVDGWKEHLDLKRLHVFRPDEEAKVDLIIRTGHSAQFPARTNEFLHPYCHETRYIFRETLFPDYSDTLFKGDCEMFLSEQQNGGK